MDMAKKRKRQQKKGTIRATGPAAPSEEMTNRGGSNAAPEAFLALAAPEVVLLGGSGDVGARLARLLLENTDAVVTSVSRRNTAAFDTHGGRLRHISHDLTQPGGLETTANACVVNLTEVTPPAYARQVVDSGGCWLESSATPAYLGAIEAALHGAAGPGTAILGVGAAPGLTNLLAAEIAAKAPETVQIDIGLEMGMGRHYGVAATEWFLGAAAKPYPVIIDHEQREVTPGQLKRSFAFGKGQRPRRAIGYGFAEQMLIAQRSENRLKTVRSFVAIDPPWMTRSLALILGLGLGPAIGRNARKLAKWMLRGPAFGQAHTRIVVEGYDDNGQLAGQIRVETGDQAEATAAVILATLSGVRVDREPPQQGATMITDHIALEAALAALRRVLPETRVSTSLGRAAADQPKADS